jgi:hypothetical protein
MFTKICPLFRTAKIFNGDEKKSKSSNILIELNNAIDNHIMPIYFSNLSYGSSMDCRAKYTAPIRRPTKLVDATAREPLDSKPPKWIRYADRIHW